MSEQEQGNEETAKPQEQKAEAPKAEEPKAEAQNPETPKAEEQKAETAHKEEVKTEIPEKPAKKEAPAPVEKPTNCINCNKPLKKVSQYYRNGKFYCTKNCYKTMIAKNKKEAAGNKTPEEGEKA